jgi:hypothetical protein
MMLPRKGINKSLGPKDTEGKKATRVMIKKVGRREKDREAAMGMGARKMVVSRFPWLPCPMEFLR